MPKDKRPLISIHLISMPVSAVEIPGNRWNYKEFAAIRMHSPLAAVPSLRYSPYSTHPVTSPDPMTDRRQFMLSDESMHLLNLPAGAHTPPGKYLEKLPGKTYLCFTVSFAKV